MAEELKILRPCGDMCHPDTGTAREAICGVCGCRMNVQRNQHGPTSYAESMACRGHAHDLFLCPSRTEQWHKKVHDLIHQGNSSTCRAIREMCLSEANEILLTMHKERYHRDPDREKYWEPLLKEASDIEKRYYLQNRYQDSGWEELGETFSDPVEAIKRGYDLCLESIHYGMVRVMYRQQVIIEFPAGGYR